MKHNVIEAALAGLLHDVGKIEQRARTDPWNPAPDVDREGQPVHATWTAYFAEHYLPDRYKALGLHAAYHHAPEKSPAQDRWISEVVALADKLSAGERVDQSEQNSSRQPPRQLVTIFDRLTLDAATHPARAEHFLPLRPLALKEDVLFAGSARSNEAQGNAYEALRVELELAARQDDGEIETYLENFAAALQRTAWCVPSAYYHSVPDISLYDHARMTAALAACLTDLPQADVQNLLVAVAHDFQGRATEADSVALRQNVALLIGGDVSGVQDFIYTLTSKNAAKTLRGRSFYLQLLTEAVLRYVLRELGIPYTNVIYSGGGHFYLLAPLSAAEQLPAVQAYVSRALLTHHGTALYLALGATSVPAGGFKGNHFKDYWNQMHLELGKIKQRRYVELGDDLYSQVFDPVSHGGNRQQPCAVCGMDAENTRPLDGSDAQERICALCASFADDIGAKLPDAKFVGLGLCEPQPTKRGAAFDALRAFGLTVTLEHELKFAEKVERAVIWALDDLNEGERWPSLPGTPTARVMRYTVNLVPEVRDVTEARAINKALKADEQNEDFAREGQLKTFNHLQLQAHGIDRLGVLRMDVDNLGNLFKDGFGADQATLSRISTLSFQLSLFFEGWIKRLCEKYDNVIYAVYAGGDDVFLIGPWNIMPELATTISDDLARYAGDNPDLHISAGLTFIHGKYPVYQAANDAHEALEQAKHIDDKKKNAVSFLGQAWHWTEFKQVTAKYERLLKVVGKPQAEEQGLDGPQAILQTLRQLAQDEADTAKRWKGRPVWGPWMWHGAYQFTRMAERAKRQKDLGQELTAIRDELSANNYGDIGQWGAAARWAQLWLRKT